jgi:lysophospholipase L1-like esterase
MEVINKGVGGHTTAMATGRFQADVLDLKPNLVIIQFGINDAAVDVWKTPPKEASRVSLMDYEKNLRRFVNELQDAGGEVILMTPNQARWTPQLLEMYGDPPYDPNDPQGFTHILSGYAQCVRDLAGELNVPLVDVDAFYDTPERRTSPCRDLLPDGMHPSEAGHAFVAGELAKILTVKQAKGSSVPGAD